MTPSDVLEAVADARARLVELTSLGRTPAEVDAVRAGCAGLEAELRDAVRSLDLVDELDWLVVDDAERQLVVWVWRRDVRSSLLSTWRLVHALAVVAAELAGGSRQKVVVVRQGESWQSIAQRELGDWRDWPRLRLANPTHPAGALVPGISLVIPDKR